ncbi:MAG: exo-alpha-sialidase [Phycisphaerales bacterium]|nr:exo-alpha-sialidase [Phycisphaerales bacterium]
MSAERTTANIATIAGAALGLALACTNFVGAQQSDPAKKKSPSSWKFVPSKSAPAEGGEGDSPVQGATEVQSDADAAAAVAMEHATRVDSARRGTVGAWSDSVQLYYTQSTELFAPSVFVGASSPTLVALAPDLIVMFVRQFPVNDPPAFGSIARATSADGGVNWSELQTCQMQGLPATMDGPDHPCVCTTAAGELRMYFIARDFTAVDKPRSLMSALSTDQGLTWRVEPEKKMPLDARVTNETEVIDLSAASIGATAHILLALSSETEPVIHAAAIADGTAVMRPKFTATAGGSWRGSASGDKNQIVFTGMATKQAEFVRASSHAGREWKSQLIEASARPPADGAIDVACFVSAALGRQLYAVVTRDENPLAQSPLATSPAASPDAPLVTPDAVGPEIAPTGRQRVDPVAAPTAPNVLPLGGKKSSPVGAQKGPTTPGLGSP